MWEACESWQEYLCLATPLYLDARRRALALVRRHDVGLERGTVRFIEKGPKIVTKPLRHEYVEVLRSAESARVWKSSDAYLIPNRRPGALWRAVRSDKVIWETVREVAERVGVKATPHDQLVALKKLMGHARETTLVYLRRKDKARATEAVRGLSWGGAGHFVCRQGRRHEKSPR